MKVRFPMDFRKTFLRTVHSNPRGKPSLAPRTDLPLQRHFYCGGVGRDTVKMLPSPTLLATSILP